MKCVGLSWSSSGFGHGWGVFTKFLEGNSMQWGCFPTTTFATAACHGRTPALSLWCASLLILKSAPMVFTQPTSTKEGTAKCWVKGVQSLQNGGDVPCSMMTWCQQVMSQKAQKQITLGQFWLWTASIERPDAILACLKDRCCTRIEEGRSVSLLIKTTLGHKSNMHWVIFWCWGWVSNLKSEEAMNHQTLGAGFQWTRRKVRCCVIMTTCSWAMIHAF